ncbi:unconventional myosin-VIIb-like [Antennarius striatus]|uniref:unconventional myosin-VIIb-like n=1 Tax=Antennarius striatus TaxID=241820 RepID=UPI0035B3777B
MHPTSVEGVDDMIQLGELTEAGLLRNLQLRHQKDVIYTYIGSVLVAVNPYQDFPIYSGEQVQLYRSRKLGELPPHIFAIAEACYTNALRHGRNQCCVISGESGAGKTESTKLILQFLAATSGELSEQQVEQEILESNPILEAFGNAKTVRNDNSSRFGKYLEIFLRQDGVIEGACVEQYLLEKSRVCHQAPEERNYHIFYCLLAGVSAEERKTLSLGNADEYVFLTKGGCVLCDGRDDAADFQRICSAMGVFFSERERLQVLKLLAAILHLGNVRFQANTDRNLETSDVITWERFSAAAALLEVDQCLLAWSLTHRSLTTSRDSVTTPLSSRQAADCRDAFVKSIYNKLFLWIVAKINSVISQRTVKEPSSSLLSIGLLDIFGFENFHSNSFEQLCINFANEKLQQFFVGHIFKLEQEEYLKEGVVWKNVQFSDNQPILELLGGAPCTLLALIDEESHFPQGSDSTLLQKLNQHHGGSQIYVPPRSERGTHFEIRHFAGIVYYDSSGFLEKNRDALSSDLIQAVNVSANQLLRQMFEPEFSTNGVKLGNRKIVMTPRNSVRADQKQVPTLGAQFRQSLDSLMKTLSACQPFFIRCFKPNDDKRSQVFDRELCLRQLRYSGMMDTVRIRKLGYPVRHHFAHFLRRYRVLLKTSVCNPNTKSAAACCEAICRRAIQDEDDWKIGKTKIFLREVYDTLLEQLREQELSRMALVIQGVLMAHKDRKAFVRKRRAVVLLQRNWRAYRDRKEHRKLQHGLERLVATIRRRTLQIQYQRQRAAVLTIQTQVRGYQVRRGWKQQRDAVLLLQAHTRGLLARRKAGALRTDMEENRQRIALEVQQEQAISQLELANEEPEPITERDLEEHLYDLQLPPVVEQDALESDEPEMRRVIREPVQDLLVPTLTVTTSTPPPEDNEDEELDDGSEEFSFYRFSILHFQGAATHTHICQRLKTPLLPHDDEGDALACLTVWWVILRFMEDLLEPRSPDTSSQTSNSLPNPPPHRRGRRLSHLVGLDQKILRKNKKKPGGGNRRASAIPEEPENLTEDEDLLIGEGPMLDRPLSSLEKLHIIAGNALSRRDIRDEVYCQICKQLSNNQSSRSRMQGWTLLSVCLGVFPPTDVFLKYLESFVLRGPDGYGAYCAERLRRIRTNGERKELPCWVELQAARTRNPIDVSVTLTDGRSMELHLDSASTSGEVCRVLADEIALRDTCGFSLYISLYDKMWSLGSGGKHVLDAVSQCEQEMRRQGKAEKDAPWSLSIRKELFRPWHDCSTDPVSTDLIYRQVIKGIKFGEYACEKEDEYVHLAAKHYYIQFGSAHSVEHVQKAVDDCISIPLIESKSMSKWVQLVSSALLQGPDARGDQRPESVKAELVDSARHKWPLYFSKFYEVIMISGPPLPKSRFVVAVNWSGVLFMDGRDKKLLELLYLEIKDAQILHQPPLRAPSVSLTTVRGSFELKCEEAEDMVALIELHLGGLRQRSLYLLAQQDTSSPDDPTFLVCKRGDLLLLEKVGHDPPSEWLHATNQRTGNSGVVHKDLVQFLPTLSRPSEDMLDLLSPGQKKAPVTLTAPQKEETVAPVSLKEFALENFRPAAKHLGRQGASKAEKLWVCSREPLKQPLMRTLTSSPHLSNLSCSAFTAILKYMGDYPLKHVRSPLELTDQIFGPATQHEALQDEIYCQIMRQMTLNSNRLSMERGWQLMWLCSGLFPPSPSLVKHTKRFLESRPRDQLAPGCLQRLQGMSSKEPRKSPPHQVEVDAIQQNSTQIFHKVHFPNDTDEIFEVTSTTTIRDLCSSICLHLQLSSADGYGLYLKTPSKVCSLEEQQYFFDSLRQAGDASKKGKRGKESSQASVLYLVMFKRKLWFNVSPGKDLVADLTFHFPQELPKYLRGRHDCTREDMVNLGGLLFRVKVDSDRSQFVMIPRMLKELVPADQIRIMSPEDWKKHIISSYNKQSGITVQEAKIAFLRAVSRWLTFGCSFFDVKQTCESSYPSCIVIAISKQGVTFIDPSTKEMLIMHPFSRIMDYHSKGSHFHMTIGTLLRGVGFVCETSQAGTMEDLLRSYISMYEEQRQAFRPRNHLFPQADTTKGLN